ncbi:MAG TPA: TlpA disulfide reductase family protein [Arachnia sp.]|nr:TlpA disulfide reductase family protein [Arachnia sp.]
MYRWIGALLAALTLAACGGPTPGPGTPSTTVAAPADLAALAEQYRLPDCPETDPDAPAVDGGLPQTGLACLGSGKKVNLAGLARTPTIVNVWAQWCDPCREEATFLREGLAEIDGVSFVGVNYNDPQPDWAIEFAGLVGWFYPHVVDQDKELRVPLRVTGIPTTLFVAADGTIAGMHAGPLESTAQLKELAAEYLGEE